MPAQPPGGSRFLSLRGSAAFAFRAVVVGLMLSTMFGVTYALSKRPSLLASFPGAATPWVYRGLLLVGVTGLVALVWLLRWRRWALVLYGILTVASAVLDWFAAAPRAHQMTVVVSGAAVFALAYVNRRRFRGNPTSAST